MDRHPTSRPTDTNIADLSLDGDRAAAERALETAQRNPILSGEQACAIAHVYALLAIEQRLAKLCAELNASRSPNDHPAIGAALAGLPV
jgi:hypothetical protein